MLISDVLRGLQRPVQTISKAQSLQDALELLVYHRIGSLLVEEQDGEIVGIITERDILNVASVKAPLLRNIPVSDVMASPLVTASLSDTVDAALQQMTERRIRHLPVMTAGRLEGLVSIGDLVAAHLEEVKAENRHLREYIAK
jgi:CBS domain-containing protein